jgi:hypothetical protein
VVERSGHRTIRVFFGPTVTEEELLRQLRSLNELQVTFERCNERYFALDLEPEAKIDVVRDRLDQLHAAGVLDYETCEARIDGSFDAAPSEKA